MVTWAEIPDSARGSPPVSTESGGGGGGGDCGEGDGGGGEGDGWGGIIGGGGGDIGGDSGGAGGADGAGLAGGADGGGTGGGGIHVARALVFCECCLLPFFVMRWDVAGFLRGENDVTYCTSSNFQHATIN